MGGFSELRVAWKLSHCRLWCWDCVDCCISKRYIFSQKGKKPNHGALWCFRFGFSICQFSGDTFCIWISIPVLSFQSELLGLILASLHVHYAFGMIEYWLHGFALKTVAFNFSALFHGSKCDFGVWYACWAYSYLSVFVFPLCGWSFIVLWDCLPS